MEEARRKKIKDGKNARKLWNVKEWKENKERKQKERRERGLWMNWK